MNVQACLSTYNSFHHLKHPGGQEPDTHRAPALSSFLKQHWSNIKNKDYFKLHITTYVQGSSKRAKQDYCTGTYDVSTMHQHLGEVGEKNQLNTGARAFQTVTWMCMIWWAEYCPPSMSSSTEPVSMLLNVAKGTLLR